MGSYGQYHDFFTWGVPMGSRRFQSWYILWTHTYSYCFIWVLMAYTMTFLHGGFLWVPVQMSKKCISLYLITNSATHMVKLKISQVKWFPDLSALIENSDHFHPPTVYPFCSCYDQSHQMWNFTWKTSSFVSVIDRKGSEE